LLLLPAAAAAADTSFFTVGSLQNQDPDNTGFPNFFGEGTGLLYCAELLCRLLQL
jgi:hypothetical protein